MKSQAVIGACTFWSLLLFCAMFSTGNSCFSQMDPGMGEGGVFPPDVYAIMDTRKVLAVPIQITPENNGQYIFDPPARIEYGSSVYIENNLATEQNFRVDWKLIKTNISSVAASIENVSIPSNSSKLANEFLDIKVWVNGPAVGHYQIQGITECHWIPELGPPIQLLAPVDLIQIIPWM